MSPNPSASAKLLEAVNVSPVSSVHLTLTPIYSVSFSFATASVADNATLSAVPIVSV